MASMVMGNNVGVAPSDAVGVAENVADAVGVEVSVRVNAGEGVGLRLISASGDGLVVGEEGSAGS